MDLNAVLRRFGRLRRWEDACVVLPSCLLLDLLLSIRKQLQMNFCSGEKEEEKLGLRVFGYFVQEQQSCFSQRD
jgi:hypothetical protein